MAVRQLGAAVCGSAALACSVFAVGGAPRWAQALVGVLVIAALCFQLPSRRKLARISPLLLLPLLAVGLCLLQLVPLPEGLLAHLDPTAAALRHDAADLTGVSAWSSISQDASGTLRSAAFYAILTGVAVFALRLAGSRRGRYAILAAVAGTCGAAAIVVGIHRLLDVTSLYGIYDADHASPYVLGPLLNSNHLGCLMAIGAVTGIGLTAYHHQPAWLRALWLALVCACGIVVVATVSRGATLAFGAGALVTGTMLVAQRFSARRGSRRRQGEFLTRSLPVGIVAACVVVVVIYSSASNVERELSRTTVSETANPRTKFAAWRAATDLVAETPLLGVGRGAFEASFTRVSPAGGHVTFSHVENEYLQALIDWGVVGALALGVCGVWLAVTCIRRWNDGPLAAGALGALAVVAVQSNVDFGVELLGVAVPITALVAVIAYAPVREAQPDARAIAARVALIAGIAAGCLALSSRATTTLDEDHLRLLDPQQRSMDAVREAVGRHPLDYYSYAVGAELLERQQDPASIRYLNQALLLHPTHPDLHRMAARLLVRGGHLDQAAIEYAAALRSSNAPERLIAEVVAVLPAQAAASAIPVDALDIGLVTRTLDEVHHTDIEIPWLAHLLDTTPNEPQACQLLYTSALQREDLAAAALANQRCPAGLLDHETTARLAQILVKHEMPDQAIALLHDVESWSGSIDMRVGAWLTACDAHLQRKAWDDAKRCLRRLDLTGGAPVKWRGAIQTRLAEVDEQLRKAGLSGSASPPP